MPLTALLFVALALLAGVALFLGVMFQRAFIETKNPDFLFGVFAAYSTFMLASSYSALTFYQFVSHVRK